ncbi:MAG: diguanylate cyclase [Solirubrobacteraceae bacterium]|nr:diguanylate cyclase [Patulibacter sp.]
MASPVAHPPDRAYDARGRRRVRRKQQRRRPESILGRRDVAIVPWAVISVLSFMVAISTWLRGPSGHVDTDVVIGAVGVGIYTAGMVAIQDTPLGRRFRGSLPVYLIGSAGLMLALAVLAVHEQGVATVFYSVNVLLAAYLGLVLPWRWATGSIAFLVLGSVAVQILQPFAHGLDAVVPTMLCIAAFFTGALCHVAHGRAARFAGALSRYDQLTAMLNRRGFLDRLSRALRRGPGVTDGPIALLIIDLDGFKQVNDTEGHAAGDEILAWVGQTIPEVLPARAELGRLGGDEFAVLLRGASAGEAHGIATRIRELLSARIGSSIGIATSETRAVAATDLFRVADAAMYLCKQDRTRGVQALVAGSAGLAIERRSTRRKPPAPTLSYAELRSRGAPRVPKTGSIYGHMVFGGLVTIAGAGTVVVAHCFVVNEPGFFNQVLRLLGVPWILVNLALGIASFGREIEGRHYWINIIGSPILLGGGVGAAMMTDGGLVAPIGAAMFLQTLFLASILPRRHAVATLAILAGWWCVVAILSPPSTLWVVPFGLAMFGCSFALGAIGYNAFVDVTEHALSLARTDALTLVKNRLGFEERSELAFAAARADGTRLGLLALDLDDFKGINDTQGHEAGDRVLRRVAQLLTDTFPDSHTVARLGGDEFVVLLPVTGPADAAFRAKTLGETLEPVVGASVGHAVFPMDGDDLDTLMHAADHRSYEVKRARKAGRGEHAGQVGTRAA